MKSHGIPLLRNQIEWSGNWADITWVNTSKFTLKGDMRNLYTVNRSVQVLISDVITVAHVLSSSFSGTVTTVNLYEAALTSATAVVRPSGLPGETIIPQRLAASGTPDSTKVLYGDRWEAPTITSAVLPVPSFITSISGQTVIFTDTSTAGTNAISRWLWFFDDGTDSTIHNPTHIYAASDTYNVTLIVFDNKGHSASVSASVIV